jgi:hypothetical protein
VLPFYFASFSHVYKMYAFRIKLIMRFLFSICNSFLIFFFQNKGPLITGLYFYFLASSTLAGSEATGAGAGTGVVVTADSGSTGLTSSFLPQAIRAIDAKIATKIDFIIPPLKINTFYISVQTRRQ